MSTTELVPIRLDIAIDEQRYQDTFCWSSCESPEAAETFAASLCEENNLPQAAVPAIVSAIRQQVDACVTCDGAAGGDSLPPERNEIVK